jgi:TolB-like protein/Tfp pilus assembly protein PilF
MICLLRVGFDDTEEADEALLAEGADRLGNYRIERRDDGTPWELGRGAMGVTYRAVDTSLQRAVALKLIDSEWAKRGAEARERFMREARTAAALRHPNVAAVHHFGIREENGQCFCAMELIEGETLEMRVRRTGPLDALTVIEIALQVSSALAAAEKQGLVHRDLKPANLMLVSSALDADDSDSGKAEAIVKVIDFGVAKALVEKPDAMGLTHGGFVGTPAFASPEQFTSAPVDVRSDIYSLGVTLWYLLTGRMPFSGANVEEIRASHQLHILPIAQLKAARVPTRLISLLVSMLALEPAARPSVRALTSKLQECRAKILDRGKTARRFALAAGLIAIATAAFVIFPRSYDRTPSEHAAPANALEKSIAVLPFENLGHDQANATLTANIQDEILTNLAKVSDLKVIGRTSVMQYASGAQRNLREIGLQLGVAYLLEGSVQRTSERLHVNAQLIEAQTGARIWAQSYDRDLAKMSAMQSEMARSIAGQLHAKLLSSEQAAIEKRPTTDLVAYDLYLRATTLLANTTWHERREERFKEAVDLLEQATARDPSFLLAYCKLAGTHDALYRYGINRTAEGLASAETAVQKALRLAPDSGEAHLAFATHLRTSGDYKRARDELAIARQQLPNDPTLFALAGDLDDLEQRYEEAGQQFERAVELDPRNIDLLHRLAIAYEHLRRYPQMAATLDRALVVAPGDALTRVQRGMVDLFWRADTRRLHATIESIALEDPKGIKGLGFSWSMLALCERDAAAIERMHKLIKDDNLDNGLVAWVAGDSQKARIAFTLARDEIAKLVETQSDHALWISLFGLLEATLGRKEEALRACRRAIELEGKKAEIVGNFAMAAAWLGEKDLAIEQLETAVRLSNSFEVQYGYLKLHPFWDPLRGDPRFEKIVASLAPKEVDAPEKSIAVLPFENLSDDKNDAFFADGVQDDILASLSKIADLKLTSRGSVQQYRQPEAAGRNLRVIATTLGVRNLLKGSVRRMGNRLLVKVQLTDALQDRLVWAERYDRSIADSITLQGELAMEIASALRARLTAEERTMVAVKPTQNAEAYVAYLRGLEQKSGTATYKGLERLRIQERLFEQAVALDPDFALAHALLSQTLAYIYHDFDPTEQTRQRARAGAATALRLQPNLGEGHFADALCLYWTEKDYEGAVRGFAKAAQLLPNRAEVEAWGSFVRRRQGRWKEALEGFARALERDPRNKDILSGYFATQYFLRDWAAARRASERAIAAASDTPTLLRIEKGYLSIWSAGDQVPLRESIAGVPTGVDPDGGVTLARWDIALMTRDFVAAERAIMECGSEKILANHGTPVPKGYFLGCVALARGDVEGARKIFETARPGMEAEVKAAPLEPFRHAQLGLLYAFMKRKEDGLREGNRAVELAPIEKDAIYGAQVLALLAVICAQTGEHDRALELIQRLLVTPAAVLPAFEGSITLQELGLRWHWDPLRSDARFKQILAGPEPATNVPARPAEQPIAAPEKSIAVLPFENRSEDKENAFFADAMQDDVLTGLVKIRELKVIGRASVMSYRNGTKRNLKEIGRELGVTHLLEGSVRRVANRVIMNVNLTDVRDGRALWAERYDRTIADSTGLQGELAAEIAGALRATLAPAEKASLRAKTTENPDAYVFYLRGRECQMRPEVSRDNYVAAANFYKQAVSLDPRFVLARARLAEMQLCLYGFFDNRPALLAEARSTAEEAVRLDPNCGQAHMALASCMQAAGESPEAMRREVSAAVRLLPNDGYLALSVAMFQASMGWNDEAAASYERAILLNPREGKVFYNYAVHLYWRQDLPRSRWASDRALELSPDSVFFRLFRPKAEIEWTGDVALGKKFLAGMPTGQDPDGRVTAAHCTVAIFERNFPEALRLLAACPHESIPFLDMGFGPMVPKGFIEGLVHFYAGHLKEAYSTLDAVRWKLEVQARESGGQSEARYHVALAYSAMGWKDAAKSEIARSAEQPDDLEMAVLFAHFGDPDSALPLLERAAPGLGPWFKNMLRLHPQWDSLRNDPRFKQLVAQPAPMAVDK